MVKNVLSGEWKGFYQYSDDYAPTVRSTKSKFNIQLKIIGDEILGTCKDEETRELFEEPADIKGVNSKQSMEFHKTVSLLLWCR